jgi:hypothetical protein
VTEDLHQRRYLVHEGTQVGNLDLTAPGQLADHELRIAVDEESGTSSLARLWADCITTTAGSCVRDHHIPELLDRWEFPARTGMGRVPGMTLGSFHQNNR